MVPHRCHFSHKMRLPPTNMISPTIKSTDDETKLCSHRILSHARSATGSSIVPRKMPARNSCIIYVDGVSCAYKYRVADTEDILSA